MPTPTHTFGTLRLLVALCLIGVVTTTADAVQARSCACQPEKLANRISAADMVFIGEVAEPPSGAPYAGAGAVYLRVVEQFSGSPASAIVVFEGRGQCDQEVPGAGSHGTRILAFIKKIQGKARVSRCLGSALEKDAETDLKWLRLVATLGGRK